MRILIRVLVFLVVAATPCLANDIKELRDYLIEKGQSRYYPANGVYKRLADVCNKQTCFIIVAVEYEAENLHGMRRLAVFSTPGKYLGLKMKDSHRFNRHYSVLAVPSKVTPVHRRNQSI